jgi:hypothetical protein
VVKVRDFAGGVEPDIARKMSDPSVFTVGNRTGLNSSGTKGTEVEVRLPLAEDLERGQF